MSEKATQLSDMLFPVAYIQQLAYLLPKKYYQAGLDAAGITTEHLQRLDAKINGRQLLKLHEFLKQYVRKDYPFSLTIGKHLKTTTHGLVGLGIMSSPTLGDALNLGLNYAHLIMPAIKCQPVDGDDTFLRVTPTVDFGTGQDLLVEISMCVLKCFLEHCSIEINAERICFSHYENYPKEFYEDYFCCPVEFGCNENRFMLTKIELSTPMVMGDRNTAYLLEQQLMLENQKFQPSNPWTLSVQEYIEYNSNRIATISKQEIAEHLHVTIRTLTRKLQDEDESFKNIIDILIIQKAYQLLRHTTKTVDQIADELGYPSAKSFSRSFKRITKTTPSEYRAQNA